MDAARAAALPSAPLGGDAATLVCARCRAPVAAAADIALDSYAGGRGTLWYPHELELLDLDAVPTYGGAKDPSGTVVNYVVRISVTERTLGALALAPGCEDEAPTAENTWFPPFEWTIVCCAGCRGHLGWLFTPPGGGGSGGAAAGAAAPFFGLRVTNLRDSRVAAE